MLAAVVLVDRGNSDYINYSIYIFYRNYKPNNIKTLPAKRPYNLTSEATLQPYNLTRSIIRYLLDILHLDDAVDDGVDDEAGGRVDLEFAGDVASVGQDGVNR